jgi:hypothetical protein
MLELEVTKDIARSKITALIVDQKTDKVIQSFSTYCKSFASGYSATMAELQVVGRVVDWAEENNRRVKGASPRHAQLKRSLQY